MVKIVAENENLKVVDTAFGLTYVFNKDDELAKQVVWNTIAEQYLNDLREETAQNLQYLVIMGRVRIES